jgi:hypothetical protein
MDETPGRCVLEHRGFVLLEDLVFQRSDADGVPVALIPLTGKGAAIPLRALQRELGIPDDSDDGRMLGLVAESLDYVVSLRPGDPFPAEVLTGEASWQPAARHLNIARSRLRHGLLEWIHNADPLADLDAALVAVTPEIGALDAEASAGVLEGLAIELSFIEASRELLLGRVQKLVDRLERLRLESQLGARRDELTQCRRLAAIAVERIAARFAEVATQTSDIVRTLRRAAVLRTYIRSHRDWLHRSRLAWEPVLQGWDNEPRAKADARAALVSLTYRFLAQRFMSVQEWSRVETGAAALRPEAVFEWLPARG